jgi:hypothetical protein
MRGAVFGIESQLSVLVLSSEIIMLGGSHGFEIPSLFFSLMSVAYAHTSDELPEMIPGSSPIYCEKAREMLEQRSRVRLCVYIDDG